MDHRRVVNGREIPVNQAKLILREQDRPDCLDLHVRKRFSDATMATCWQEKFFKSLKILRSLAENFVRLTCSKWYVGKLFAVCGTLIQKPVYIIICFIVSMCSKGRVVGCTVVQ